MPKMETKTNVLFESTYLIWVMPKVSGVFRGYKIETLASIGLRYSLNIELHSNRHFQNVNQQSTS